jgi:hypothetical protein
MNVAEKSVHYISRKPQAHENADMRVRACGSACFRSPRLCTFWPDSVPDSRILYQLRNGRRRSRFGAVSHETGRIMATAKRCFSDAGF